jgi:hypothetical protein
MNKKKLAKIRREIEACRRKQVKARDLISIAKKLGRQLENRGKEPVFSYSGPHAPLPLAIPDHGGKDLPVGTKRSILNVLEDDVTYWELMLDDELSEARDDR